MDSDSGDWDDLYGAVGEFGRPRWPVTPQIVGSNPIRSATGPIRIW